VPSGTSLLELAALHRQSAWEAVVANGLEGTWEATSGDILLFNLTDPAIDDQVGPSALPGEINSIEIDPLPFLQGKATLIRINADSEMQFSGSYMDHELHFFQDDEDVYIVIQGTHALAEPGLYPLQLDGSLPNGSRFSFSQMVPVGAVDYPYDRPLTVNPTTIDPAVTRPEDAQWVQLASPATSERMWQGIFQIPSPLPADYCIETGDCWSSRFGNRRSYNGGPYNSFHTGLDIVGKTGTEIYAPAPGVVIFAGPLTVRGNATMIDHGWGVYTAYMHQDEMLVEVGDKVEPGQLIGRIGNTGRVEGPHLHWEVWAGGVQVDPLDWLLQAYP
jgi:murein DD-endopeptidase MepM/ murein hydrolase activator NlpD